MSAYLNALREEGTKKDVLQHLERKMDEIDGLRALLEQWRTWGIVEIAVRNPDVRSYMDHWESRAEKAEAEVERLRDMAKALEYAAEIEGNNRRGVWVKAFIEDQVWAVIDFQKWKEQL